MKIKPPYMTSIEIENLRGFSHARLPLANKNLKDGYVQDVYDAYGIAIAAALLLAVAQ